MAIKVAVCESGLDANAHNFSHATRDDSWGVFQINRYGSLASRPPPSKLKNFRFNIRYAYGMYSGSGWSPWVNCSR